MFHHTYAWTQHLLFTPPPTAKKKIRFRSDPPPPPPKKKKKISTNLHTPKSITFLKF